MVVARPHPDAWGLVARLAFPRNDFRAWQRVVKIVAN
jgi:hypothetical protein